MTREAHWARVTGVVEASLQLVRDVADRQTIAAQQLDAAQYTLSGLLDDLAAVMPDTFKTRAAAPLRVPNGTAQDFALAA